MTVLSTGFCSCVVTPVYTVPFLCAQNCPKQSLAARTFIKINVFCFLYWVVLKKACFRVSTSQISHTCHYFLNLLCSSVACRKWHSCEDALFSWGMRAHLVFTAHSGNPAPSPSLLAPGPHQQILQLNLPCCGRHQVLLYGCGPLTEADTALQAGLDFRWTGKYRGNRLVSSTCEMWRNMPLTPKGLRVLQLLSFPSKMREASQRLQKYFKGKWFIQYLKLQTLPKEDQKDLG